MTERLVSWLVIVTGLISTGVGLAVATGRLKHARRAYHRTQTLYDAMPEGWTSWFLQGFSGLTMGTHWLRATLAFIGWSLAGLGLIGLGVRLVWR